MTGFQDILERSSNQDSVVPDRHINQEKNKRGKKIHTHLYKFIHVTF